MATGLAAIEPKDVAILYNSADAQSRELAEFYAEARSIPAVNLIGLRMPRQAAINRKQYEESIARPLRQIFDDRSWWKRRKDVNGVMVPTRNQIRVLLTVRGVPLTRSTEHSAAHTSAPPSPSLRPRCPSCSPAASMRPLWRPASA